MSGLTILIVTGSLPLIGFQYVGAGIQPPTETPTSQVIPLQTDDGLDPINLIFTGYAPSWWVAANMAGWSDSAYCSGPKTLDGRLYNYTLEHPDPTSLPCIGPRDHIRIWDMGYSTNLGEWSVASTHHEHTVCDPVCHHVIDSWSRPQADAQSAFVGATVTSSISNYTLQGARQYQGVSFNGNATMIELKPPSNYPVTFSESGLGNQSSWSVTLNGAVERSIQPSIVFDEPNGTYDFTVTTSSQFVATPSSGNVVVDGGSATETIRFETPWTKYAANVSLKGRTVSIEMYGNATVTTSTVQATGGRNTIISFNATEDGARGVLNVTVPRSAIPIAATTSVYVDGLASNQKTTSDSNNLYTYFLIPFGKHSVQLQFSSSTIPFREIFLGGVLAATGGAVIFFVLRSRREKAITHN